MAPEVAAVEKKGGYNNLVSFHWLLVAIGYCCVVMVTYSVIYGQWASQQ